MWSLGCILVELYTGYPIFPGESEAEQLQCIMEIMGTPPPELLRISTREKLFFDPRTGKPKLTPNKRGKVRHPGTRSLSDILRKAEPDFVDLVTRCLEWIPSVRITPD